MNAMPNPFLPQDEHRFVLDEEAFLQECLRDVPVFLGDPSDEFLKATDLMPILEVLAR